MTGPNFARRRWLSGACGLGMGMALGVSAEAPPPSGSIDTEPYPRDADEALARLKNGNQRFMDGKSRHLHQNASWRSLLVETQKPFATVLGCSDSRVPPELVFDAGFGDLFIIRLIGNIIAEDVIGSLQYAVAHLHTPLIVVLGHEGCGAVTAAVKEMQGKLKEPQHIEAVLQLIKPGLTKLNLKLDHAALMRAAVEANVHWSMQQLTALPGAERALREKRVALVGGVYEMPTGRVRFLD